MVRICCPAMIALSVTLPGLTVANGPADIYEQQLFYNQQPIYNKPQPPLALPSWLSAKPAYPQEAVPAFPQNTIQMPTQQLLELSGQQLAAQQMGDNQGLGASSYLEQQNAATMAAEINTLQAQLARERTNEVQLVNLVAHKQHELQRANASFAHIVSLAETGSELEHELRKLLANATAKNEGLQEELHEAKDEVVRNEGEVAKWRDEAKEAEKQVKQSAFLQKRTEHVMQNVKAAQAKVRRTEEIIHSLLPRLEPQLHEPANVGSYRVGPATADSYAAADQSSQGTASRGAYDRA